MSRSADVVVVAGVVVVVVAIGASGSSAISLGGLPARKLTETIAAYGDPKDGFHVRSFSTSRDVDPVDTPYMMVERRHAPPEAAVVYVRATDHPPG